ncbi:MAG: phosphoenolpyruvate synthase [Spirochaetales bacterium]|nr:phosphoenolpyruvate synthase [Spirochaetales bacterium]
MENFTTQSTSLSGNFPFQDLMSLRVREILLVCSDYDHFMLEEDGRIEEQLFQEYVSLSLRYPPQFTHVSSAVEAVELLAEKVFDLVIVMLSVGDSSAADLAKTIKVKYPAKPIVLLTPVSTKETMRILRLDELRAIDYIFSWQGNSNIMLAMVKLLEDSMNVDRDVKELGVQCIILVEDSVRYYSSYLPVIYESLIRQAHNAMNEGLNEWQQTIRMRGRPKILLARNFEEAVSLYEKYKDNLLGVISDIAYNKNGSIDNDAGYSLCSHIRAENLNIPILLQSSNADYKHRALQHGAAFIHKQTKTLLKELEHYIKTNYGFGDFIFRDPSTGKSTGYVRDLRGLQQELSTLSDKSFTYHVNRNDFSRWLMARSLFNLAKKIRAVSFEDTGDIKGMRDFIIGSIKKYRTNMGKGVIAEFDKLRFDELSFFSRIGNGSLGGKGRGLAFINQQLKEHDLLSEFPDINISIPRTIVLTTKVFDDFISDNDLYSTALNETDDGKILQTFIEAKMPIKYLPDFETILEEITTPIAVRSSSLLEDSHHQPFAGIYKTYMLSNENKDFNIRRRELLLAVKAVYASTYFQHSKAYMKSTNNIVEDEKMAIVIQEVVGRAYGRRFYPNISGVARSLNFYPIGPEKPEDGIAEIAFGLGKTVVDGGTALRFSPAYPKKIIQLTDPATALKTTQQDFFALNLDKKDFHPEESGKSYLISMNISEAENDGSMKHLVSTFDFENNRLRDGGTRIGKKVLTFAGILKYKHFPLAEIITSLLKIGREAMNVPIEIEFAINIDTPDNEPALFSFLQIRPIVENLEISDTEIENNLPENTIIYSEKALGNGVYKNIKDIVYIKPGSFDRSRTKEMSELLHTINKGYIDDDEGYVLVVQGRLGSTDPWLGIPLSWPDISQARIIVESGTRDFRVEPSQGTHFFQNITSLGCGYLTINPDIEDGIFKVEALDSMKAVTDSEFIRIVRFDSPLVIKINGKTGRALISKQL